jgi:subtilisin family serine protease
MTPLARDLAYRLLYAGCEPEPCRFTSDLPLTADVWLQYAGVRFKEPIGLLLTPHCAITPAQLREAIHAALHDPLEAGVRIAANESHLLAPLGFLEMLRLLPLTAWWQQRIAEPSRVASDPDPPPLALVGTTLRRADTARIMGALVLEHLESLDSIERFKNIGGDVAAKVAPANLGSRRNGFIRLVNVAAEYVALSLIEVNGKRPAGSMVGPHVDRASHDVLDALAEVCTAQQPGPQRKTVPPLWHISRNRPAEFAVHASRRTVKADAAIRLFDTGGKGVRWAIVDSGIDARHPAFCKLDPTLLPEALRAVMLAEQRDPRNSRIVRTLDFTRLHALTSGAIPQPLAEQIAKQPDGAALLARARRLGRDVASGRMLDWAVLESVLTLPMAPAAYAPPSDSHGTHVAGILGANWQGQPYLASGVKLPGELLDTTDLLGICPAIELLDLRVFDADGKADEFTILAALQYIRYLNQSRDQQYVHGVNISLSLRHEVRSYGCGSTPICLECNRLVGSGVVVVAAAGNYGYDTDYAESHLGGAYRGQSLTDPGNAADVITVGATHRTDPYLYGVSYFSSRGPSGDGRAKPDLVAPGEKIVSTLPNAGIGTMDGTSMAAPHVSGAAALLLARNPELMGQPARIKRILCESASDLGRERAFQGSGLVDALRALQSI